MCDKCGKDLAHGIYNPDKTIWALLYNKNKAIGIEVQYQTGYYEKDYIKYEIPIKYCPICGNKL